MAPLVEKLMVSLNAEIKRHMVRYGYIVWSGGLSRLAVYTCILRARILAPSNVLHRLGSIIR
jgi:hypothetical protein